MNRNVALDKARGHDVWDVAIIGGGATGLGAAVEATTRGLSTILLERRDFAAATSSRSTKLVHGGVRYLEQGNISLVREALHERARLLANAPHLVHKLFFVVPCYRWWEKSYYRAGLAMYDLLAGSQSRPRTKLLSAHAAKGLVQGIETTGLRGGVCYWDGQFDDARLAITLARTADKHGATLINYAPVIELRKEQGKVTGVDALDAETKQPISIRAKCVINATGIFVDEVRQWDDAQRSPMLAYSQGIHLVLPRSFLQSDVAIIVPKTKDGRVVFIIPWHGHVVVGTTDTPIEAAEYDPQPQEAEIEFLLEHAAMYLSRKPERSDVTGIFVGIRPLVRGSAKTKNTAKISRDHTIAISDSGLVTITGGKWTTYRKMGQDVIDTAIRLHGFKAKVSCTADLRLIGADRRQGVRQMQLEQESCFSSLDLYGDEREYLEQLIAERPELGERLVAEHSYTKAEMVWGIRREMARTIDDLLFRRTRLGLLDSQRAQEAIPIVRGILRDEGIVDGF